MNEILMIILLTLAPFLELRASIPYGIARLGNGYWLAVFLIAVITNIFLAFLVYIFVNYIMHLFLKIKQIDRIYQRIIERTQRKIHPYVEKYGVLGLAVFIGVPLPGSGVYSGCLGAYLLGFSFKDYIIASIIGVIIAGILVTLISLSGIEALRFFIKI